jgi:hypothetical protein
MSLHLPDCANRHQPANQKGNSDPHYNGLVGNTLKRRHFLIDMLVSLLRLA